MARGRKGRRHPAQALQDKEIVVTRSRPGKRHPVQRMEYRDKRPPKALPATPIPSGSSSAPRSPSRSHRPSSGGGIKAPKVQSPADLQRDLTKNYIANLDKIAAKEFESYSKFAPQYAQKQHDIIKQLYPSQSGLGELISKDVTKRLQSENYQVPEAVRAQYQQQRRGADVDRGMFRSGMSGRQESYDLSTLGIQMRQNDINTALALHSGVPKAQPMQGIPGQGTSLGLGQQASSLYSTQLGHSLSAAQANQNAALQAQQLANQAAYQQGQLGLGYAELNRPRQQPSRSNPWGTAVGMIGTGIAYDWLKSKI